MNSTTKVAETTKEKIRLELYRGSVTSMAAQTTKSVTPECFNRGSSPKFACDEHGPTTGKTCGNDGQQCTECTRTLSSPITSVNS